MNRIDVLQALINRCDARTYLEIGVSAGTTFLTLKAKHKIAVDPRFKVSWTKKLRYLLTNPSNRKNTYHEITSDLFFETQAQLLDEQGLDVVFVDGLHTYEQALRDVESCLKYLKPGGAIVMHDCDPPCEAAAIPAESRESAQYTDLPNPNNEWCGDTYKALIHLRSTRSDLNVFVIDCDYGLGVVTKGDPESTLDLSPAQIAELPYSEFEADRENLLNLKSPAEFRQWVERPS